MDQTKIIDEYKISLNTFLGEGSFGKTYEAFDNKGNVYACKVIEIASLKTDDQKKNLIRELKNGFKLKNKHIMRFYDVKRSKNNIYLFLEYCKGITLNEFLIYFKTKFKKNLPLKLIQIITIQLINALTYLSNNNVLHRDIKTENIMLSCNKKKQKEKREREEKIKKLFENTNQTNNIFKISLKQSEYSKISLNGKDEEEEEFLTFNECDTEEDLIYTIKKNYVVKLIDYGLSKEINDNSLIETVLGTPLYISPEIWKKYLNNNMSSNNTKKIDIFSTGIVLYNLIYGNDKIPYVKQFKSIKELGEAALNGKYYVKKQENLCLELVDLLNGMMKTNENVRYGIEQLINHPFVIKKYEELTEYNIEEEIFNGNDENNLIKFEIKNENIKDLIKDNNEEKDSEIDKYIDNLFLDDGIIIDYTTKENEIDDDWTLVDLNDKLI